MNFGLTKTSEFFFLKIVTQKVNNFQEQHQYRNTSLAAPGALANRLQRRTARKANEANLDPPNQKSDITSL